MHIIWWQAKAISKPGPTKLSFVVAIKGISEVSIDLKVSWIFLANERIKRASLFKDFKRITEHNILTLLRYYKLIEECKNAISK